MCIVMLVQSNMKSSVVIESSLFAIPHINVVNIKPTERVAYRFATVIRMEMSVSCVLAGLGTTDFYIEKQVCKVITLRHPPLLHLSRQEVTSSAHVEIYFAS